MDVGLRSPGRAAGEGLRSGLVFAAAASVFDVVGVGGP